MNEQLVKLFNRVEIVDSGRDSVPVPPLHVHTLNTAAASFGYSLDTDVISALMAGTLDDFNLFLSDLVRTLARITGANHDYQVLFSGFPYEVPEQRRYFLDRVVGMIQNHVGYTKPYKLIGCGHLIDPGLFDVEKFGACPICQFQIDGLSSMEKVLVEYQPLATPLKLLGVADAAFLTEQANAMLARPSSLSLDERAFLLSRLEQTEPLLKIPAAGEIFRETVPLAWLSLIRHGYRRRAARLVTSATDVLRIATLLSDPMADLSLKDPVKFKLCTSDRKEVLRALNDVEGPEEDMLRRAERFKKLAFAIKPGTAKNRKEYPCVAAAYDAIMRHPKTIETFNRTAEKLLKAGDIDGYADLLVTRPGEFMRKLDLMLRRSPMNAGHYDSVLVPMTRAVKSVPTPLLFTLSKYLINREDAERDRTRIFRPKGTSNKIKVIDDTRPGIAGFALISAGNVIDRELQRRFADLPPLGSVWIDPALDLIPLPVNRRGDSSTSAAITKGMRWPLAADAEVVRLFVWWRGNVDVDLSASLMDESFCRLGHVAFTNLEESGCVHSGDIQNASKGAAEFIDIPINYVAESDVRYICMSVISWRGDHFNTFPCHAGFMQRDAIKSGQRFEPQSVSLKFDINVRASGHVPLIFDVQERRMIYADLTAGQRSHASALGHSLKFQALARAVVDQPKRSPTVGDIVRAHVRARGSLSESRETSDQIWSAEDLDWNRVNQLLE